ncbi:MAG: MBL fold metallo-hydrolase [Thermoleophilaceae bacterium]|nr:MBL fold metallo-hydrolase [Thermoleophilaceae bacterium]
MRRSRPGREHAPTRPVPGGIDIIVLSHGHWDHTTGMDGLVGRLGRVNMPVLIHPEFWSRRRLAFPGRDPVEP